MARYRYRTKVLVGPWRRTRDEAAADAIRAGQAEYEAERLSVSWRVPGQIEREADAGGSFNSSR